MKFEFDIETPENCVKCPFGTVDKVGMYGGWIFGCRINRSLQMPVDDALKQRHENCPGMICDPDYLPGMIGDP